MSQIKFSQVFIQMCLSQVADTVDEVLQQRVVSWASLACLSSYHRHRNENQDVPHTLRNMEHTLQAVCTGPHGRDRVRNSDIRRDLRVQSRSASRGSGVWLGGLLCTFLCWFLGAGPTGRRPLGWPGTRWRDQISHLAKEGPWVPLGGAGNVLNLHPTQQDSG